MIKARCLVFLAAVLLLGSSCQGELSTDPFDGKSDVHNEESSSEQALRQPAGTRGSGFGRYKKDGPACGNGVIEDGETCDGKCPASCNDYDGCTTDTMVGSPYTCDSVCHHVEVVDCVDGDGCCAPGCDGALDSDCGPRCGNGATEPGEVCDGDCPTMCNDGDRCTVDTLVGAPDTCDAACVFDPITVCGDGDGCCAPGCNATNDSDCTVVCGNGVVEPGETCDGSGCPTAAACDDGDACTTESLVGGAATCDAACVSDPVVTCVDGDGCCPSGCKAATDDDCAAPALDCSDPTTWPAEWKTLEDEIFAETNRRRTDPAGQYCGTTYYPPQPALTFDPRLREAARCHVLDMITNDFFSHAGSDGSRVGTRADRAGYNWHYIGENLAAGNDTAPAIVNQWMNSESHCRNVMKGAYEELGVGYAFSTDTTYWDYSAQVFGTEF